ncbi:hypothetical protein YTPLAS72_02500 [Nitrospira sp.]|nr:hypothetical protein YTPLAS72_02500 [Nitrospira sp.]
MKSHVILTGLAFVALLSNACANKPAVSPDNPPYNKLASKNIKHCTNDNNKKAQEVRAETITLNVQICVFYSGDGLRPDSPKDPTALERTRLTSGEVYFVALLRDGANMKNLEIKSDILGDLTRSEDVVFNYDLYQGSPSERLEVDLGVFDDDGWPSDRADKLKVFQDNLGSALELFPAATVGIPFIDPFLKLIVATVNLIDPDDSLISTKVFIEKGKDADGTTTVWKLYNPFISTDNGTIYFTINPQCKTSSSCQTEKAEPET